VAPLPEERGLPIAGDGRVVVGAAGTTSWARTAPGGHGCRQRRGPAPVAFRYRACACANAGRPLQRPVSAAPAGRSGPRPRQAPRATRPVPPRSSPRGRGRPATPSWRACCWRRAGWPSRTWDT